MIRTLSEDLEQINFVNWFRYQFPKVLIIHIPNGGKRHAGEAAKLKRMGVVAGVPDLFIPEWRLWVEMKRVKGGKLSENQKNIIPELERIGYTVVVCNGFEDAKLAIEELRK